MAEPMEVEEEQALDIYREFVPGVFWVGGCLIVRFRTPNIHSHMSAYVVRGSQRTLFVDTGHPKDWPRVREHIDDLVGDRGLDYIFPTHQEYPHAGNLGLLLRAYPEATVVGDVRDYHAYFPAFADRFRKVAPGEHLDLGDREFVVLPAPLRDLPSTLWGYDTRARVMFVSDGFAYSHQHLAGECDRMSEELGRDPSEEEITFVNERALHWTKFVDSDPMFDEVADLLDRYPADFIAPAHGNVISNPDAVVPLMRTMMGQLQKAF